MLPAPPHPPPQEQSLPGILQATASDVTSGTAMQVGEARSQQMQGPLAHSRASAEVSTFRTVHLWTSKTDQTWIRMLSLQLQMQHSRGRPRLCVQLDQLHAQEKIFSGLQMRWLATNFVLEDANHFLLEFCNHLCQEIMARSAQFIPRTLKPRW